MDCIEQISQLYKEFSTEDIAKIISEHEKLKGGKDFVKKAGEFRKKTILEKQMEISFKAEKIKKNILADQFVDKADWGETFYKNPNEILKSKFFGSEFLIEGGNDSFIATRDTFQARHMLMVERMGEENLKLAASGEWDINIADAYYRLNNGQSITGYPSHVQAAATTMRAVNTSMANNLQDVGIQLNIRDDFIGRQTHDPGKVSQVPFESWEQTIEPRLDPDKTYIGLPDLASRREFLKAAYDDIISGEYGDRIGSFGGKRVLHFKDGIAWAEYNQLFGKGNMLETMMSSITASSKAAATARTLGPDIPVRDKNGFVSHPTWDRMEKRIAQKLEEKTPGRGKQFLEGKEKEARDAYKFQMFGFDPRPERSLVFKLSNTAKTVTSGSDLGLALLSAVPDMASSVATLRAATGARGAVEWGAAIGMFKKFSNTENMSKWAQATNIYFGHFQEQIFDRFGIFEGNGKKTAIEKIYRKSVSLSGLPRFTTSGQINTAGLFASELGINASKSFDKLNPRLRASIERVGITADDWEILRNFTQEVEPGHPIISGDSARSIPSDMMSSKKRTDLAYKMDNYLRFASNTGIPEATALERAFLQGTLDPNSVKGAIMGLASQYKTFGMAIHRVWKTILMSNPDVNARTFMDAFRSFPDASIFASYMTESMILAGIAMIAREAAKGKVPNMEVVGSKEFMVEAFARGALPLYMSYMMDTFRGEYNKFGRSILKDIAGPVLGQIPDVVEIAGSASSDAFSLLEGKIPLKSKTGIKSAKFLMDNMPGANLPLAKAAMNRLFLTDVYDYFQPGYELRLRRKAMKEGTEFILRPY